MPQALNSDSQEEMKMESVKRGKVPGGSREQEAMRMPRSVPGE